MKLQPLVDAIRDLPDTLLINIETYNDALWYASDNELHINTDGNKSDLECGDGNTYSFEVRYIEMSDDGYVIFYDADSGCGRTDSIILRADQCCEWED